MPVCKHCRREIDEALDICPHCRTALPDNGRSEWVSIARISNLAEVGFFAELLTDEGFKTNVVQHDRFSAIDGSWSVDYFLQVKEAHAETAADTIQQHVQQGDASDTLTPASDDNFQLPSVWKPLILCALAGGVVYGWGRFEQGEERAPRPMLWEVLRELDVPLETPNRPDTPAYRLRADRASDLVWLDEDRDGDGWFEHRLEFREGELLSETELVRN